MYSNQFIIENPSPFDVASTVKKLIEAATNRGWQNPAVHDFQHSLSKSGKTVRPVQVVEVCKPDYSGHMLEKNHERIASVLMPVRISVYEKEDGKTYVALLNIAEMTEGMPQTVADAMHGASDETFDIVKSVIGSF